MKCKYCKEKIDLFTGKETKIKVYFHVFPIEKSWGWCKTNLKNCSTPKPKNESV